MAPDRAALGDLFQRVTPPLQPHLHDHRFFGDPRGAGDFKVEGVEWKEHRTRRRRRSHRSQKPIWIAPFHKRCAGSHAHSGTATT